MGISPDTGACAWARGAGSQFRPSISSITALKDPAWTRRPADCRATGIAVKAAPQPATAATVNPAFPLGGRDFDGPSVRFQEAPGGWNSGLHVDTESRGRCRVSKGHVE